MSDTSALSIRDLAFRYGRGGGRGAGDEFVLALPVLEVARGEQVLIRGSSGSGKSTLLQIVAGLMDPLEGVVLVDGVEMHRLRGAARDRFRGRRIGMIFQTFNLLHGFTAVENVMAAMMFSRIPRREHRPRAEKLLQTLGIEMFDRDPQRLSVGQQQRVAVARAVACDPVLVLADEPTASLDPDNATGAIELIKDACVERNAALITVSHDPTMHEHFERVITLETAQAGVMQ